MYRTSAVVIAFGRMRVIDVVNIRTICIHETTTTSIYSISRTTVARPGNLYDNKSIRVLSVINIFLKKRRLNGHFDSYTPSASGYQYRTTLTTSEMLHPSIFLVRPDFTVRIISLMIHAKRG